MNTTRLSDREFFTSCLDTSIPAFRELPAMAQKGDIAGAQKIFADYVRTNLDAARYLSGEKEKFAAKADEIRADAERVLAHTFISCRVPHTFEGPIDWECNPTYNGYKEWGPP